MEDNLVTRFGQYVDAHLYLKMITHFEKTDFFPREDILKAKIELLAKTHMVTYTMEEHQKYCELVGAAASEYKPPTFKDKEQLTATLNNLLAIPFLKLISEEKKKELEDIVAAGNWNLAYLQENYGITSKDIAAMYDLAKFYFECGQYGTSGPILRRYLDLLKEPAAPTQTTSTTASPLAASPTTTTTSSPTATTTAAAEVITAPSAEKQISALWGKLASDLAKSDFREVTSDFEQLEYLIENCPGNTPLRQLQQRTWVAHWIIFTFFQLPQRESFLLDFLLGNYNKYVHVISIKAPYLLRYLAITAIITKTKLKEVADLIESERPHYTDKVLHFVYLLHSKCDFEAAEKSLAEVGPLLDRDYFVLAAPENIQQRFLEAARLAVCEADCKTLHTIDIAVMAKRLHKSDSEAERWIVNLIRSSRMDAKIDTEKNLVVVHRQATDPYQSLLEKTKGLTVRAGAYSNHLERAKQLHVSKESK